MGQSLSCGSTPEHEFFKAVKLGQLDLVAGALQRDPSLLHCTTVYDRLSPLHMSASNGRIEVLSEILQSGVLPDVLNRYKQTPLMLAAMNGKISCVQRLLQAGANILMFDSLRGRTCLHYAAYYGHIDCLQAILASARSSPIAESWGFARFVNVKDDSGATPLHLAARQRRHETVHALLDNGALVSASTGTYGYPGSSPLHLAARNGSVDCIRVLLAWGADRMQRDASGRIPYSTAHKRKHTACAALLNPSSAEPLVWPSPLKFISELNPETKVLLERALMEANRTREENILKGISSSFQPSPSNCNVEIDDALSEENDPELCCICFDQQCTIEVRNCGHQMCASCTLALCCHSKPNPATLLLPAPLCPFCRSNISQLVVAPNKNKEGNTSKLRRKRRSQHSSEGSSSFKGLSSAMGSLGKLGRGSGRISNCSDLVDKP